MASARRNCLKLNGLIKNLGCIKTMKILSIKILGITKTMKILLILSPISTLKIYKSQFIRKVSYLVLDD